MSAIEVEGRVEALLQVLPIQGSAIETARRFVLAVAKISPDLLPEALQHPFAAEIRRGRAAYPELIARLASADDIDRSFILEAIGRIARAQGASESELTMLRGYAQSDRLAVAGPAQLALAMAGDPETMAFHRRQLGSPEITTQVLAARVLGYGRHAPAIPDLLVALRPDRPTLAAVIIWALGEIGDPNLLITLHAILADHFHSVLVIEALASIGRAESFGEILPLIASGARDERIAALSALAQIAHRDGKNIAPALVEQARPLLLQAIDTDESQLARYYAYVAFVRLGGAMPANRVMRALGAGLPSDALDPMAAFFSKRPPKS